MPHASDWFSAATCRDEAGGDVSFPPGIGGLSAKGPGNVSASVGEGRWRSLAADRGKGERSGVRGRRTAPVEPLRGAAAGLWLLRFPGLAAAQASFTGQRCTHWRKPVLRLAQASGNLTRNWRKPVSRSQVHRGGESMRCSTPCTSVWAAGASRWRPPRVRGRLERPGVELAQSTAKRFGGVSRGGSISSGRLFLPVRSERVTGPARRAPSLAEPRPQSAATRAFGSAPACVPPQPRCRRAIRDRDTRRRREAPIATSSLKYESRGGSDPG
jgi:hypothetical protein